MALSSVLQTKFSVVYCGLRISEVILDKYRQLIMKLLLTSTGLTQKKIREFFVSQFDTLKDKKSCLIFTVRTEDDWKWLDLYDEELKDIGLAYDVVNISEEKDLSDLPAYDIYYVCGGNAFYILDRFRKTHLDKRLLEEIENGKFYIGVSAGSIVVGPNIQTAVVSGEAGDENDIHLEDLSGFHLVPFCMAPHFVERLGGKIERLQKEIGKPIAAITDEQAVFVTDQGQQLIGDSGGLFLECHFDEAANSY